MYYPTIQTIRAAASILRPLFPKTPLQRNEQLSNRYKADIYLKREDLTPVRSYKLRGAYNKISSITSKSIVSCSAGNHAQGVAFASSKLGIYGTIFIPVTTPQQKIKKVKEFGGSFINVIMTGSSFDDAYATAKVHCEETKEEFIHPFDDEKIIEGQGTVGLEIIEDLPKPDYVILPIGGGGLAAGVSAYIKQVSPFTKIIGVEPLGAPSMTDALHHGRPTTLEYISTFVDGASVKRVGTKNFPICQKHLDDVILIDEGHVCSKILEVYNQQGIIVEPAGVLSLCALDRKDFNGSVLAVISGGNSDVFRMPEILERSLVYEGVTHYLKIQFPQRPGALKDFIVNILEPEDDIIYFKYTKVIHREEGPVLLGIQLKNKDTIHTILKKMRNSNIQYKYLTDI